METAEDARPAGTVRYDLLPEQAGSRARWEVSITVAPDLRGRGLGSAALSAADSWLIACEPAAAEIVAYVRRTHIGSLRLFERSGYSRVTSDDPELECLVRRLAPVAPPISRTP